MSRPAAAPLRFDLIPTPDWQPAVGALGAVVLDDDDVAQCVRTVLSTPQGSVPHRPEFGSNLWRYLDQPAALTRAVIVRDVLDALAAGEPRIEVVAILDALEDGGSTLRLRVTWRRKVGPQTTTTTDVAVSA